MPLLPAGAVHETLDAIFQMDNTEVYKEADGFATEFEVRKDLDLMDR